MADQTLVNGDARPRAAGSAAVEGGGVAEFVDDLSTLVDLQFQLAAADCGMAARKSAIPLLLTLSGLALILASVPVALFAIGWLLASALRIHQGWAMVMAAAAAMVLGGLTAGLAWTPLRRGFDGFHRSRKQLLLNLTWVRTVLVTRAETGSRPRRRA